VDLVNFVSTLNHGGSSARHVDLAAVFGQALARLPVVHRILAENVLRCCPPEEARAAVEAFLTWGDRGTGTAEIPFLPSRILMHDTTCVPALVDIAAMRDVLAEAGIDPSLLNPVLTVDVSVDHSVAVDHFATEDALARNMEREFARNSERYRLMKWAGATLSGLRVHPPGSGIMHTINLERLATIVSRERRGGEDWLMPDTLIGTDSHTPMINGLGVLGWGVGGLEAEGAMFGMPVMLRVPDVIGVRLSGSLPEGVLATDLAMTVTERLRRLGVAGSFVEFFGPGLPSLSVGDRAAVANMAPEYGASTGYFPVDQRSCDYLVATGRQQDHADLVAAFAQRTGLWFDQAATPRYTDILDLDLSAIRPSVAGPRRPQDRRSLAEVPGTFSPPLATAPDKTMPPDGAVALAAITSCTNTSDPRLLVAAGLLARKARELGLSPPAWVKTSLAPGSPTAQAYLARAGLLDDLEALGFGIVGYGCTTCIGNSGPILPEIVSAVRDHGIRAVAVLSGNRNFPGRVHPDLEHGFLASPPLVIAYALAGDVNRDIATDPITIGGDGRPVHLADLWPSGSEIDRAMAAASDRSDFETAYRLAECSPVWAALEAPSGARFPWSEHSTYLRRPPFVMQDRRPLDGVVVAHPLLVLGDDITTDHISPAGQIRAQSDAGVHLVARGDDPADLNVFASRRGNWEPMIRGLFTNRTVRNLLDENARPGETVHAPSGEIVPLTVAADRYAQSGEMLALVAGERYGTGSSRDWAAKGVAILGVRVVLAASFERIHRSNLIGMGILPLVLPGDRHPEGLALRAGDRIAFEIDLATLVPRADVQVTVLRASGESESFPAGAAIETRFEVELLRHGGIIPAILRRQIAAAGEQRRESA